MLRNRCITFLIILLLFSGIVAQTPSSKTERLPQLIATALKQNPQLKGYERMTKASEADVSEAGTLPDPTMDINVVNLPWNNPVFDREAMSGKQIRFAQKFPFPGKLRLRENIAAKQADIARAQYLEFKNRLIREVKIAYYDLYYVDQALHTTRKNRELLKEFVHIATAKYAVGKGLQQDVLKAQVELARQNDRLLILQQKRKVIKARLNRLLNRNGKAPVGTATVPDIQILHRLIAYVNNVSFSQRPLLQAWQQRLEQSKERLQLAQKSYWPDFTVSLAYTQRDVLIGGKGGTDFISLGLHFNLPVYARAKQSMQVRASILRKQFNEQNLKNVQNQISEALNNAISALKKNLDQENLYRFSIIPQAKQALESARAGYQNDKVDFLTLLNNEITLFKIELSYRRIVSEAFKSLAEVEYIIGHPVKVTTQVTEEN